MYHKKSLISRGKKWSLSLHSIAPPLTLLMNGTQHTSYSIREHRQNADGHCDRTRGYLLIEEGKQVPHHCEDRPGQGQEEFADVKRPLIEIIYSCRTERTQSESLRSHLERIFAAPLTGTHSNLSGTLTIAGSSRLCVPRLQGWCLLWPVSIHCFPGIDLLVVLTCLPAPFSTSFFWDRVSCNPDDLKLKILWSLQVLG